MKTVDRKKCPKCRKIKSVEEFYRRFISKDKLSYSCKICCVKKDKQLKIKRKKLFKLTHG